jgi:hypothetical protein
MPFVDFNAVKQYAQVLNLTDSRPKRQYDPGRPLRTGLLLPVKVWATEAARHVRDEELHNLVHRHLKIGERAALPSDLSLAAPDKVCTDPERNHHEAVSDLNGLAVTAAFEWRFARTLTAFGYAGARRPDIPEDEHGRGVWLTRDAARYESEVSQYKSRLAQMVNHPFDWLVPFLESATKRLQDELERDGALGEGGKLEFEVPLRRKISVSELDTTEKQETELVGRPDIVHVQVRGRKARVTIWEIKFVGGLALEHAVQAVVYGMPSVPILRLYTDRMFGRLSLGITSQGCAVSKDRAFQRPRWLSMGYQHHGEPSPQPDRGCSPREVYGSWSDTRGCVPEEL